MPKIEQVYAVTDYYDGAVGGVANFGGRPHTFQAVFNEELDNYERGEDRFDLFYLREIDQETLQLVIENCGIWTRWQRAFHSNETLLETHPALPQDRARHEQIARILKPRLEIDPTHAIKARGKFDVVSFDKVAGKAVDMKWQVEWLDSRR